MKYIDIVLFVLFWTNFEAFAKRAEPKTCRDCMPFTYCKNAKDLAETKKDEDTKTLFRNAFCGYHYKNNMEYVKICCSEFDSVALTIDDRWSVPEQSEHPNLRLLPQSCGVIARDRIVGGEVAGLYEFPWMVVLAYRDEQKLECAGTLINSKYVLTAAHCVLNKEITNVRIGDFNLVQELDCQGVTCERDVQYRKVERDEIHEDYNWDTYTNDIALLRLNAPVTLGKKNANPICLPTTSEIQQQRITDKQATVSGWGLNEHGNQFSVLRKVDIPVLSNKLCQGYYRHITESDTSKFCAGVLKKDACRGDSGGPLMVDTDVGGGTKIVQYGIVSHGQDKCGEYAPGVYTNVTKYMNWILDNIRE